ncbi:MAG: fibronectin type III domain-containing protein [Planctomycetia bacterium]|nr:fibronectin type III domain-containing protein [Planctomycetia bacterium]
MIQSTGDTIYDGDDEDDNVIHHRDENGDYYAYKRINVYQLAKAIYAMGAGTDIGDTISTAELVSLSNNSYAKTDEIGNGIYGTKDVDMYKVYMLTDNTYTFTTSLPTGGTSVDTYIRLFDSNGTQLDYNDDGNGTYSQLSYTPTSSGYYYLGVSSYRNKTYSATLSGLAANTTYYVKIKANGNGTTYTDSGYSSYKSAKTEQATTALTGLTLSTNSPKVGTAITATVSPSGATATYQWSYGSTTTGTFTNISGATSASYTPTATYAGKYLRCTATGTGNYTGSVRSTTSSVVENVTATPTQYAYTEELAMLAYTLEDYSSYITEGSNLSLLVSEQFPDGIPFTLDKIFVDKNTDFDAYALTPNNNNYPSILVFRGTYDELDFIEDLNPNGIGINQYQANKTTIHNWMKKQNGVILTGHSMGGAMAQLFASEYTSTNLQGVITFNSPGICQELASTFETNWNGKASFPVVEHHVTSGDIVSLAGEAFLHGDVYLYSFYTTPTSSDYDTTKHSSMKTTDLDVIFSNPYGDDYWFYTQLPNDITFSVLSSEDFNASSYNYNDSSYDTFTTSKLEEKGLEEYALITQCRSGVEFLRQHMLEYGGTTFTIDEGVRIFAEDLPQLYAEWIGAIQLSTPTLHSVTATGSDSISVSWNSVSNASGYTIMYATNSSFSTGVKTQNITSGSTTSATISGLAPDTTYYFRVKAVGTGNYTDSGYSSVANAKTEKATLKTPALTVAPAGNYELNLTIGTSPYADYYKVEYSRTSDFSSVVSRTYAAAGTYKLTGLAPNTMYYFRVMALSDGENLPSAWSATTTGFTSQLATREAASTVVTTTLDVVNAYDGVISLREAISHAAEGDIVTFDESMRNETIVLNGSWLYLNKAVSLDAGDKNVTIDADGKSSVLVVDVSSKNRLMLRGLTFANGYSEDYDAAGITIYRGAVSIVDCVIRNNTNVSSIIGTALRVDSDSELIVENTRFLQNRTEDSSSPGTTIFLRKKATFVNCEIAQNDGNGVEILYAGTYTFTNCTIVGNSGSGIDGYNNSYTVYNSIITSNIEDDIVGKAKITNSIIGTLYSGNKTTLKNTQTGVRNPGFANLPDFSNYEEWLAVRDQEWDLSLAAGSSAINAGNTKLTTTGKMAQTASDVAGNARFLGSSVDIGAYEFQSSSLRSPEISIQKVGKNILVSWDAVAGADSYIVEYRIANATKWTVKAVKKGTSLTISGKVGSTYDIRVASVASSEKSVADTSVVTLYAPLATPKLKSVKSMLSDETFAVDVTNLSNTATSMTVGLNGVYETFEIANQQGGVVVNGVNVAFANGRLSFSNASSYTSYKLEVSVSNELSGSAIAKLSVKTTKTTYNAPTNVTATVRNATEIDVSWDVAYGKNSTIAASKYTVQYSTDGGTKWRTGATVSKGATTCTLKRLTGGTEYQIRVLAVADTKFLVSQPSNVVTKTTLLATPKISSVTSPAAGQMKISWNSIKGADKYEIQYRVTGTANWDSFEVESTDAWSYSCIFCGYPSDLGYDFRIRAVSAVLPDTLSSTWSDVKPLLKVR